MEKEKSIFSGKQWRDLFKIFNYILELEVCVLLPLAVTAKDLTYYRKKLDNMMYI